MELIKLTNRGLYCEPGDFYIDPWKSVPRAIVTHAHSDHAHYGMDSYIAEKKSVDIMRLRVGRDAKIEGRDYGETFFMNDVKVSLHPAGHIFGSSQVRVEYQGEVWVFTGDCKRDFDPSCTPFEVVKCDTFITEATFALPIYQWTETSLVVKDIYEWWMKNRERGMNSILCVYALGKAQRVLAELLRYTNETVHLHGALLQLTQAYREAGIQMVPTVSALSATDTPDAAKGDKAKKEKLKGALILAPPSAAGSVWTRRFEPYEVGFASGWMAVRGNRRRNAYDRGFVISDHSAWNSLIRTIEETGCKRVLATHGSSEVLARYVTEEMGLVGEVLKTEFNPEEDASDTVSDAAGNGAPEEVRAEKRVSLLQEKPVRKKKATSAPETDAS